MSENRLIFPTKHRTLLADVLQRKENSLKYIRLYQLQKQQHRKKKQGIWKVIESTSGPLKPSPSTPLLLGMRFYSWRKTATFQIYSWYPGDCNGFKTTWSFESYTSNIHVRNELGVCRNHSRVRVVPSHRTAGLRIGWLKEARPHTYCTVQTVSSLYHLTKKLELLTNPMHDGGEGPPSPQAASFFLFFLSLLVSDLFLDASTLMWRSLLDRVWPLSDPSSYALGHWEH